MHAELIRVSTDVRWVALASIDPNVTYIELSGFTYNGNDSLVNNLLDLKDLAHCVWNSGVEALKDIVMVGVQKQAIADIQKMPNFIPLFEYVRSVLKTVKYETVDVETLNECVPYKLYQTMNMENLHCIKDPNNPIKKLFNLVEQRRALAAQPYSKLNIFLIENLHVMVDRTYAPNTETPCIDDPVVDEAKALAVEILETYPRLKVFDVWTENLSDIFNYINQIDQTILKK